MPAKKKSDRALIQELEAALPKEKRPWARTRLKAVLRVLQEGTWPKAARAAKKSVGTIARWMRGARRDGVQALLFDGRGRTPRLVFEPRAAAKARADIARALRSHSDAPTRRRLIAVDRLLAGDPQPAVAKEASVAVMTIRKWRWNLIRGGVEALLSRTRKPPDSLLGLADPQALRALATREKNPRFALRFTALALLAEGLGAIDVSARIKASHSTVKIWKQIFLVGGIEALRNPPPGRACKLSEGQIDEVAKIVDAKPGLSYAELCGIVAERFEVRYTESGMRRLLSSRPAVAGRIGWTARDHR